MKTKIVWFKEIVAIRNFLITYKSTEVPMNQRSISAVRRSLQLILYPWRRFLISIFYTMSLLVIAPSGFALSVTDVSSQVTVTRSGLVLNRLTNTFDTLVTITNSSSAVLNGPLVLVISNLAPATVSLANPAGQDPTGNPIINLPISSAGLAPGQSISKVLLKFSNPNRVTFTFFDSVNQVIPSGTNLIDKHTFDDMVSQGTLRVRGELSQENANQALQDAANQQIVANFFATHPSSSFLANPNNLIPDIQHTPIKPVGDGNFKMLFNDAKGHPKTITTLGLSSIYLSLANGIQTVPSDENQRAIYTSFYNNLQKYHIQPGTVPLPPPDAIADFSASQIQTYNNLIVQNWKTVQGLVPSTILNNLPPANCDDEIGAVTPTATEGDRTGQVCSLSPNGIMGLQNYTFPLQNFVTCIKNQGNRGTCHSFASIAALEETYAKLNQKWVNLSEQDLMNQYRLWWHPVTYHDGGDAWEELTGLRDTGYALSFEEGWGYNPSYNRGLFFGAYYNSCLNYSETCSDPSHQGREYVTQTDNGPVYGYASPVISNSNRLAFTPQSLVNFWDVNEPELSTEYMLLHLIFGQPVIIDLILPMEFWVPDANGFVTLFPFGKTNTGEHTVNVIGFITNEDLAKFLPNAPPGAGAGYFIIKNSWGACFGDAGYVYLPWALVRAYVLEGMAITD